MGNGQESGLNVALLGEPLPLAFAGATQQKVPENGYQRIFPARAISTAVPTCKSKSQRPLQWQLPCDFQCQFHKITTTLHTSSSHITTIFTQPSLQYTTYNSHTISQLQSHNTSTELLYTDASLILRPRARHSTTYYTPRQVIVKNKHKGKWTNHHIGCMRDERQEDWGIFVHFFIGLSAAVSSLHKHAIQKLSIPPNTPHHTFNQTQVPRHHQNINKHCPHSPTQCSQTIITYHDSIPPHILPHTRPQFTCTLHPYSIHNYNPETTLERL